MSFSAFADELQIGGLRAGPLRSLADQRLIAFAAVRGKPGFKGRMGLFEPSEVAQILDRVARPLYAWNVLP